jgi:hypothetical protein
MMVKENEPVPMNPTTEMPIAATGIRIVTAREAV